MAGAYQPEQSPDMTDAIQWVKVPEYLLRQVPPIEPEVFKWDHTRYLVRKAVRESFNSDHANP